MPETNAAEPAAVAAPAPPPISLTIADVLEAEAAELGSPIADAAYLAAREKHLREIHRLEAVRKLSPDDPRRKEIQQACDAAEKTRLDLLMPLLRAGRRAALCFSGGGIRSATFGLGILQGLARYKLIEEFDYLSTVSGGGYIGSWLSAWRSRNTIGEIETELARGPAKKVDGEIGTVEHLRSYSNYLSPRVGLMSADSWTLAATVIRNMFLNWLILVPILAAALLVPKLVLEIYSAIPTAGWLNWGRPAVPAHLFHIPLPQWISPASAAHGFYFLLPDQWSPWLCMLLILMALGFLSAVIAVRNIAACLPSIGKTGCTQDDYLLKILFPLSASAILLNVFWAAWHRPGGQLSMTVVIVFGALLHWAGWWLFLSDSTEDHRNQRLLWAALSGAAGGWVAYLIADTPVGIDAKLITCFAFPAVMGIYFFATALFIGLDSRRTNDDDREWWARSGGWILIVSVGWIVASLLVVYGLEIASYIHNWVLDTTGLATGIGGSLAGRSAMTASSKKPAEKSSRDEGKKSDSEGSSFFSKETTLKIITTVAPVVFLFALLVVIAEGSDLLLEDKISVWIAKLPLPAWLAPMPLAVIALMIVVYAVARVMSLYINVNTFSLHAMYRSRLIRAYLGASNPLRNPNLFTGFDKADNLHMHLLPAGRPFHVVNMCLNLVHGKRLAWQERKAETFTVSRLHSGSIRVGYQKTEAYGGRKGGITLGTAMAISGAAASPNMGYHSSPLLTFLMTFFNARLGWWLANPGYPGENYWEDAGPKSALRSLVAEGLGNTDDESRYVYLSDGGHFENLGLYEMVLRRCTSIVIIDAGADPLYQFEDLANAIRKIRVDLGISIVFEKKIVMSAACDGNVCCARAKINYSDVDGAGGAEATLVYIKPVMNPGLSVDLTQYHSMHPDFPQQPTADQFFDEAQFESYRRLGFETVGAIAGASGDLTVDQFVGKCAPAA